MIHETIDLYDYFGADRKGATGGILSVYARSELVEIKPKLRPAVLVIPGGGYGFVSAREGEPVALAFMNAGYSAFCLTYTVNTQYPTPLNEALMAMRFIRENAKKYCIAPEKVVAIGFSAGGHLAGLVATVTKEEESTAPCNKERSARPDAVVLSYPVVTMGTKTHGGTRDVISGKGALPYDMLSIEKRVSKESAPAFIWHTFEDNCVPVENSLLLASAYRGAGVPFSLHIFEKGWHGLSVCTAETHDQLECDNKVAHIGKWFSLALGWLAARGFAVKVNE
ncbi:MAG: alpha/beta hydrolase [Clostridia bacterium]|nr:alpha/beta hydrolase [Clostridia bacterium]